MDKSSRNRIIRTSYQDSWLFLILIVGTVAACTDINEPLEVSEDVVLELLVTIPEIPVPPETEQNKDNEAFLLVTSYCQDVIGLRYPYVDNISSIRDENLKARIKASPSIAYEAIPQGVVAELRWVLEHSDNQSSLMLYVWLTDLEVSPDDELTYLLLRNGPIYEFSMIDSINGSISPSASLGLIRSHLCRVQWQNGPVGISTSALSESWTSSLIDSIDGGGSLYRQIGLGLNPFYAYWDTSGHGRYTTTGVEDSW
ncbi:hypothetical protein ACFL6R_04160 [Gemmatimonadota bacterium]